MAKKNRQSSGLGKPLSPPKVGGSSFGTLLKSVNLISQAGVKSDSPGRSTSLKDTTLTMAVKNSPAGIRFGRPSNLRTPNSQSSHQLTTLVQHAASGGFASAFGAGLSGFAGLGGLASAIIHLFGGGNEHTLPPLIEFQLPQSQEQTLYVSSKGIATFQGTAVEQASRSMPSSAPNNTGNAPVSSAGNEPALRYQSMQIAQAVKNALLNSSTLNDVIAEI